MHLTTLLFAATNLLTSTTHATPIQPNEVTSQSLLPRQDPSTTTHEIKFCEHIGYKGKCETIQIPEGQCVNIPDTLEQKISSMRIPKGTNCLFIDNSNCPSEACATSHCEIFDHDRAWLNSCGGWIVNKVWAGCKKGWNDRVKSVKCYTKT
ncbi:hypothetical protein E6O75_ATG00665 [Venturia nashicola]|uniref:Uncharacterized protein n=1 Tax=Venturia nashicola TaxID=86259 RepID=A0A4Z1PUA9_9PEZI|nr:hypothetical protein E6O75_ATG00665 [Venturia nashicola]